MRVVVVVLTSAALGLARDVQKFVEGVEIHGPVACGDEVDEIFDDAVEHVGRLFREGVGIIGICASGILIRAVAGSIRCKYSDPPVLSIAQDGGCVVPLLGGHHGANDLARRVAGKIGGVAAITTASDGDLAQGLETPPPGWSLSDRGRVKLFLSRVLSGEKVAVSPDIGWLPNGEWVSDGEATLRIESRFGNAKYGDDTLIYHPHVLAIGVGCEQGVCAEELTDLVHGVLDSEGLSKHSVAVVASVDRKVDEEAIHILAGSLRRPARFLSVSDLLEKEEFLTEQSRIVRDVVGVPGVAESAALVAAGRDGRLLVSKRRSARATCAVGWSRVPIDPESVGFRRGRVSIVGIGAGAPEWLTQEARDRLCGADAWVGYGEYLDRLSGMRDGQKEYRFDLGDEMERARKSLELASGGREVALISSGDPTIYGMGALVCELLDRGCLEDGERRVKISICPGISAFQAVSARVGAVFGNDFCVISLSDLLTPWSVISQRVHAAGAGDFVVAFYNPRSGKRLEQLGKACAILRKYRLPETPVIVAKSVGSVKEEILVVNLADFVVDDVDMKTLVIVGSTQTCGREILGDGRSSVYTPRGYDVVRRHWAG